jgi:hypothetical protein
MSLDNLPPNLALRDKISNIRRVLNVTSDLNANATELFLKISIFFGGDRENRFLEIFPKSRTRKNLGPNDLGCIA